MNVADKTIRHVAREANVSVTTVSRVMNGSAKVSNATREKVLEAAEKLQFTPSRAAIALVTKRTRTIGLVVPYLDNSIFSSMIHEIEQTLSQLDYFLVIAVSNNNLQEETASADRLLAMGAEGLILSGADHDAGLLARIRARNIPAIFTSVWDEAAEHPTIGYDNFGLAQMAIRHLEELGHRNIAVLHGPIDRSDRTRERLRGLVEGKSDPTTLLFFEGEVSAEAGARGTRRALESTPRPTAAIGLSDIIALGAIFEANRQKLTLPGDLSIMGFDNLEWSEECCPRLTTLALPTRKMANAAAKAIVAKIEDDQPIAPTRFDGHLIVRESTAPPSTV